MTDRSLKVVVQYSYPAHVLNENKGVLFPTNSDTAETIGPLKEPSIAELSLKQQAYCLRGCLQIGGQTKRA